MRRRMMRVAASMAVAALIPLAGAQPAGARTAAVSINFDDRTAPCLFIDTVAAREEYAAQGVHFRGPGPLDGGGILNECGAFGVSGHSSPNFLGFNKSAAYSDGGVPRGPETVLFNATYSHVELKAGSIFPRTFRMGAYNGSGQLVGSAVITLTPAVQTVHIDAAGIRGIRFFTAADYWVIDDLAAK